jgi:hypothetical protein
MWHKLMNTHIDPPDQDVEPAVSPWDSGLTTFTVRPLSLHPDKTKGGPSNPMQSEQSSQREELYACEVWRGAACLIHRAPTPEQAEALARACKQFGIDLVGPPLS